MVGVRVLAVDPGGTTGIAFYDSDGLFPFSSSQHEGYEDAVEELSSYFRGGCPDALVCEGFTVRNNTHKLDAGAFSLTTDLIGACRLLAMREGIMFVRQAPAQAKGFATDDKLRTLGWYNPSKGGHQNDAARHLLTYLAGIRYAPILTALTQETA